MTANNVCHFNTSEYTCVKSTDIVKMEHNQYNNLNLNQNLPPSPKTFLLTIPQLTDKRKSFDYDSKQNGNGKAKFKTYKESSNLYINTSKIFGKKDKDRWKDSIGSLNDTNNSTLSLHIASYENSVETDAFDQLYGKLLIKETKQNFNVSNFAIQNSFEFPRQQNDTVSEPELSQFRASQQLANPNKLDSSKSAAIVTEVEDLKNNSQLDAKENEGTESSSNYSETVTIQELVEENVGQIVTGLSNNNSSSRKRKTSSSVVEVGKKKTKQSKTNKVKFDAVYQKECNEKRSTEVLFPYLKEKLEDIGIKMKNEVWIKDKLSGLNKAKIDLITTPGEGCQILEKNGNDGERSFHAILRAINFNLDECESKSIVKYVAVNGCVNQKCVKVDHKLPVIASAKRTNMRPKQIEAARKKHSDELKNFILSLISIQTETTNEIAQKWSTTIIHNTGLDGLELVKLMRTEQCSKTRFDDAKYLKVAETFKKIISFISNPNGKNSFTGNVRLCQDESLKEICFNIEHCGVILKHGRIQLSPRIRPDDPHLLEMQINSAVEIEIDESYDEEDNQQLNTENDEIGIEDLEDQTNHMHQLCDSVESNDDVQTINSTDDEINQSNLFQQLDEILPNYPKLKLLVEKKETFYEFVELLQSCGEILPRKQRRDLKEAMSEAEKYIIENVVTEENMRQRDQHNFKRTKEIILPFIAGGFLFDQMTENVKTIAEDLDLLLEEDEIKTILQEFKIMYIDMFINVLRTGGFNSEEGWARSLSPVTIGTSAYDLTNFAMFYIAKYHDTENFLEKFFDKKYVVEAVCQYRKYLIEVKIRQAGNLRAMLNFYHGKNNTPMNITFDSKEYEQMEASSIVKAVNSIGVGVKIAGIFERNKSSFPLSRVTTGKQYVAMIKQDTVSSVRNVLPIMDRDLLIFLKRFEIINIENLQEKLFHQLSAASGWRIESIIAISGKLQAASSEGLFVRNVSFNSITVNGSREIIMNIEMNHEKTRKSHSQTSTIKIACNNRKYSFIWTMIEFFQLRGLFKVNIFDDPEFEHPEALQIKDEVKDQFLFCKLNAIGQLIANQCLGITNVYRYMQNVAKLLNIPQNQISHRSYRKGAAFKGAFKCMTLYGELVTLRQISAVLNTLGLWHAESSMRYLRTRDKILEATLQKFSQLRETNPNIMPDDIHEYISDKSLVNYVETDHEIVQCIFNFYNCIWKSSSSTFRHAREAEIACAINNFLSDNLTPNLDHQNMDVLNPKNEKFDVINTFGFYNDPHLFVQDTIISCFVEGCDDTSLDPAKHFRNAHGNLKTLQCQLCDTKNNQTKHKSLYEVSQKHYYDNHLMSLICLYCNECVSRHGARICKKNLHNVVPITTYIPHYKTIEQVNEMVINDEEVELNIPSTVNVTFGNVKEQYTVEEVKKMIEGVPDLISTGMMYGYLKENKIERQMFEMECFKTQKVLLETQKLL